MTKLPFASSPSRTEFTNPGPRAATASRSPRKTNIRVLPAGGVARQASCWACTGGAVPNSAASKKTPLTARHARSWFMGVAPLLFLLPSRDRGGSSLTSAPHCSVQRRQGKDARAAHGAGGETLYRSVLSIIVTVALYETGMENSIRAAVVRRVELWGASK